MAQINWLHLSDWHQEGKDFDRKVLRDALIADLRARSRIDSSLEKIDFVIFSGDLTVQGRPSEFESAGREFLDPVMDAVGLTGAQSGKAKRLFLVPGNHDLDRDILGRLPLELQKPLSDGGAVKKWLTVEENRKLVLEPFGAYRLFVDGFTGQASPDYASVSRLTLTNGFEVAILGLNSAWMCGRNRVQNEVRDYGYLVLGEPQVHDALNSISDCALRIVVVHHPFEWLAPFDRDRVEGRLLGGSHFILSGHTHQPRVRVETGTYGNCVIIPAGTGFDGRCPTDPNYANAYNFVHLDLEAKTGEVHLRKWCERQKKWDKDVDTYPDGRYEFSLPGAVGARAMWRLWRLPASILRWLRRHPKAALLAIIPVVVACLVLLPRAMVSNALIPGFGLAWPSRNMLDSDLTVEYRPCTHECLEGVRKFAEFRGSVGIDSFAVLNFWKPGSLVGIWYAEIPGSALRLRMAGYAPNLGIEVTVKDAENDEARFRCSVSADGSARDYLLPQKVFNARKVDLARTQLIALGPSTSAGTASGRFQFAFYGAVPTETTAGLEECVGLLKTPPVPTSDCQLRIESPRTGSTVGTLGAVDGTAADSMSCREVIVVIHPIGDGCWVQDRPLVNEGKWHSEVHYGEKGLHYQDYEVVAVASPKEHLQLGAVRCWPEGGSISNMIKVTKTPEADR